MGFKYGELDLNIGLRRTPFGKNALTISAAKTLENDMQVGVGVGISGQPTLTLGVPFGAKKAETKNMPAYLKLSQVPGEFLLNLPMTMFPSGTINDSLIDRSGLNVKDFLKQDRTVYGDFMVFPLKMMEEEMAAIKDPAVAGRTRYLDGKWPSNLSVEVVRDAQGRKFWFKQCLLWLNL